MTTQAELCRATMCAACWAVAWAVTHRYVVPRPPVDWSQLPPAHAGMTSEAHREPPGSGDENTIPLCTSHRGGTGSPLAFAVRLSKTFATNPGGFYRAVMITDFTAVRDEMRRRKEQLR